MTPQELQFAALRETGVVAHDEVPSAEQGVLAEQRYANLHAMLLHENLATWAVDEDIPDKAAQPMIWMLAFLCGPILGVSGERVSELASLGAFSVTPMSLGERQLRRVMAADYVPQTSQAEYF